MKDNNEQSSLQKATKGAQLTTDTIRTRLSNHIHILYASCTHIQLPTINDKLVSFSDLSQNTLFFGEGVYVLLYHM